MEAYKTKNGVDPFKEIVDEIAELKGMVREALKANNSQFKSKDENEFLGMDEACQYLGKARQTVYQLSSKGLIKCIHQGRKLYFLRDDLKQYVLSGRKNGHEIEAGNILK